MKKRLSFFFATLFILLPAAVFGSNQGHLIETTVSGSVDWTLGRVSSTGTAAPVKKSENDPQTRKETMEKARSNGLDMLFETIKQIRRQADQKIGAYGRDKTGFMEKIAGMVANATVAKQEYLSDGAVRVIVCMDLSGGFAQYVLPEEIKQVEPVKTVIGKNKKNAAKSDLKDTLPYTGLIIDADTIEAQPAMMPLIMDENGKEVYGPAFVSREFAVQYGMTGYSTTLEAALADKRAGSNPLVVKGLKIQSPGNANIMISNTDASRLKGASANLSFLKQCKVVIVIH